MPRPDGKPVLNSSPFDVAVTPQATQSSPFDAANVQHVAVQQPWRGAGVEAPPGAWVPVGAISDRPPGSWVPGSAPVAVAPPPPRPDVEMHSDRTRYFVITSNTKENVVKAVRHSMWATQKKNEVNLDSAFRSSPATILIFSVNGSDAFQGYARMRSPVGKPHSPHFDPFNRFGRLFDIEWLRLHDLPYREVEHIRNPLNGDRPVRMSRDGQELSNSCGRALCGLIDRHVDDPQNFSTDRPRSRSRDRSIISTLPINFVPKPRSSSSESESAENRTQKRRTPHPLSANFEEQVDFFLNMDYAEYVRWWAKHGGTNPGPAPPLGSKLVQNGSTPLHPLAHTAVPAAGVFQ